MKPLVPVRRMFDDEDGSACKFSCYSDALHQPKNEKNEWRGYADRSIGRHQPNRRRWDCHHEHGEHEHFLAPEPIAEIADDRSGDRSQQKAECIQCKSLQRLDGLRQRGRKEQFADDRCEETEGHELVEFEHGSQ
jgi:hypothetical protein